MNCKNCGHPVAGNFCSHCGQKSSVGKINAASFITEVSESIFQIDRGFFYTLKELLVRPGHSIQAFLEGKRASYFKPIAYVLLWSTVYFLVAQSTRQNTFLGDVITGWMRGAMEEGGQTDTPKLVSWLLANYAYATLLLLPVFSLASYLAFFNYRKTYLEHIVINAYITGQQAIFYTVFVLAGAVIDSDMVEQVSLLVVVSYAFWVFWQLFPRGKRLLNILRSILTYVLYLAFSMVLLGMFMSVQELG